MNNDEFTSFLGQYGVAVRYLVGGYRYGQPFGPSPAKRPPLQPTEEFDLKLLGDIADALHNIGRPNGIEYFNQSAETINRCWSQCQPQLNPITAGLLPIPHITPSDGAGTGDGIGPSTAELQANETAGRMYEACDIIRAIEGGALKTIADVKDWAEKSATSCEKELRDASHLKNVVSLSSNGVFHPAD